MERETLLFFWKLLEMKSVNGKINEGGISKVLHQGAQLLPEMARKVAQIPLEDASDRLKCPRSCAWH